MNPEQPQAEAGNPVESFNSSIMRIAEIKNGKSTFITFLEYGLPTLNQVLASFPAPDSWKEEELKEGEEVGIIKTPVYEDAKLDYLQNALTQRIQGIARGKYKAGMAPANDWVSLFETSGGGRYMSQVKLFKDSLVSYLTENTELNPKQVAALATYTDVRKLGMAKTEKKARVGVWLNKFIDVIEDTSEVANVIKNLRNAIDTDIEEVEF